jgi:hypothetical protein
MKWLRYLRLISLVTQVGITSQRNIWANTDPGYTGGGIRCLGGVSIPCRPIKPEHNSLHDVIFDKKIRTYYVSSSDISLSNSIMFSDHRFNLSVYNANALYSKQSLLICSWTIFFCFILLIFFFHNVMYYTNRKDENIVWSRPYCFKNFVVFHTFLPFYSYYIGSLFINCSRELQFQFAFRCDWFIFARVTPLKLGSTL